MKVCTFCGCKTDDKSRTCASCGSSAFMYVCPNCQNHFEGAYCPDCGTRFNAIAKVCPNCSTKYFSKACPNCGHIVSSKPNVSYGSGYGGARSSRFMNESANTRIAFVCAIMGFMMMFFPLSIIAIIFASKEKKAGNDSALNKCALILGIISLALGIFIFVLYLFGFGVSILAQR